MTADPPCPKCSGSMTRGFTVDTAYGGSFVSRWVEGDPEISRLWGLKVRGKKLRPITTFRCDRCGFLESFAAGR